MERAKDKNFNKKIGFVSLGCDKNRVDTEKMITILSRYPQFSFVSDKNEAEVIIINTCAFLNSSREEARSEITEIGKLKENGKLEKLIVAGCLPSLEKENLKSTFNYVDYVLLKEDYNKIDEIIFKLFNVSFKSISLDSECRWLTTPMHYAYLKIADGCSNRCAFCKIPFIKGSYKSVPMEELIKEAELLCDRGVKEIILVAQDITRYGMDLYKSYKLCELIDKLSKIKKLSWIRLLYCYPDMIDDKLIETIKNNPKVVKYIDIPLQHISDNVLSAMKRHNTSKEIEELILKLRKNVLDIKIRSTFMVGFPGETKKDFKLLLEFLEKYKLDNVGFFKYSREEGTASFDYKNQVDEKIKDKRLKKVQNIQEKIAIKNNKKLTCNVYKVLVDSYDEKSNLYFGRPYFSAPDVDFEVAFSSFKKISIGSFVDVEFLDFKQGYFLGEVYYNEDNA